MSRGSAYDEWEGFDGNAGHYDEKKEKAYQARIWWIFLAVGIICLLAMIRNHISDYHVVQTYQCIEAEYVEGRENLAHYYNEEGQELFFDIPSHAVRENNGKVLLYYEDNYKYAQPVDKFSSWVWYYVFVIALLGVSGARLWKIFRG